jgi:hydrogen peroxide-dependent heme synthase
VTPAQGQIVLHLFFKTAAADAAQISAAAAGFGDDRHHFVSVAILGHKADLCIMALGPDVWRLRRLQTALVATGLDLVDSYFSLTEVSEYAKGMPDEMIQKRLFPQLPPAELKAFCFYPMTKSRDEHANWYTEEFDERKRLMLEHGTSGRKFAGRVVQVVTGSTGIDDFEWGVTLFGRNLDDLKEVVYTMRFDEASARFGVFERFLTGVVGDLDEVLEQLGVS